MLKRIAASYVLIVAALLVGPAQIALAQDGNLLNDASFEDELAPDQGGWTLFDESIISDKQARSGDQSVFNGGISRTVSYQPFFVGIVSGSFQELSAAPGSRWRLTGYGLAENALKGTPAFGIVQVSFFDAEDNDIGTVETAGETTQAQSDHLELHEAADGSRRACCPVPGDPARDRSGLGYRGAAVRRPAMGAAATAR